MLKHLKTYHLFENIQDDEGLLEIKDIVQDIVDEFDFQWVDEIDWFNPKKSDFIYNIRRCVIKSSGNFQGKILVDFVLPTQKLACDRIYKDWHIFISQIEECIERLVNIGYGAEWIREGRQIQIQIAYK